MVVPPDEDVEVWQVRVRNADTLPRALRLYSFVEFAGYEALTDMTNLQRTRPSARCGWTARPSTTSASTVSQATNSWQAVAGAIVAVPAEPRDVHVVVTLG